MGYYKFNGNKVDILKFLEGYFESNILFNKEIVESYNDKVYNFYYLKQINTPFVVQVSISDDEYIVRVTPTVENAENEFDEKSCIDFLNIFINDLKDIFMKYKIGISYVETI